MLKQDDGREVREVSDGQVHTILVNIEPHIYGITPMCAPPERAKGIFKTV
jgi:hypothetical protein